MPLQNKWVLILGALLALLVVLGGGYLLLPKSAPPLPLPAVEEEEEAPKEIAIGKSLEGRSIDVHTFGSGDTKILIVGGIHGGYEWNSVLLSYEFIDYFETAPDAIPAGVTVSVIPSLNPDAVFKVLGKEGRFVLADVPAGDKSAARFNARGVDLNRNFDCKWQPEAMWRGNYVSAGSAPFSEPEAAALKRYVEAFQPDAVVFYHSQSNAVYASECENGILPATRTLMNTYALAAGYPAVDVFDAYPVTGDAEGWLASIAIPAISVELSTHETIEWEKNLAGVQAMLDAYGK
jgi:hypothetical protein